MLHCSTLTTSCCAAWCPLHQVVLFDLVCMVLGCLIFSASCCRLISPAYPCVMLSCLIFSESRYATRSGLHNATLLDCRYLMLNCWTFPTVCYVSWCSLYHVMLFDLVIKTVRPVRCLIFYTSCYVLDLPLLLLVFSICNCWVFCLVFMLLRCLTFSTSC